MSARKIRRAAAHAARKADRKAGFSVQSPTPEPAKAVAPSPATETIGATDSISLASPEPGFPFPSFQSISSLPASSADAPSTAAPVTQIDSHADSIRILTSEDAAGFEALKRSLIDEHAPATPTESILVNRMAESHWLEIRAQRMQDVCIDPATGAVTDEKNFSFYTRCKTTHIRTFHKALNDLLKLRREKQRAALGVEAQKVINEKHEMKKQSHYWDVLKKDAQACHQLSLNITQNIKPNRKFLASKRNMPPNWRKGTSNWAHGRSQPKRLNPREGRKGDRHLFRSHHPARYSRKSL